MRIESHARCSSRTRRTVGGSAAPAGVRATRRSSLTSESKARSSGASPRTMYAERQACWSAVAARRQRELGNALLPNVTGGRRGGILKGSSIGGGDGDDSPSLRRAATSTGSETCVTGEPSVSRTPDGDAAAPRETVVEPPARMPAVLAVRRGSRIGERDVTREFEAGTCRFGSAGGGDGLVSATGAV